MMVLLPPWKSLKSSMAFLLTGDFPFWLHQACLWFRRSFLHNSPKWDPLWPHPSKFEIGFSPPNGQCWAMLDLEVDFAKHVKWWEPYNGQGWLAFVCSSLFLIVYVIMSSHSWSRPLAFPHATYEVLHLSRSDHKEGRLCDCMAVCVCTWWVTKRGLHRVLHWLRFYLLCDVAVPPL
jgi:hypothetical protein